MPVDVLTEIVIERPRDLVARFAEDPTKAPQWYVNIRAAEWRTTPPLRVGSQLAFVAHFLGRRLAYTYEVIDYAPTERLVMRTSEGRFPMETTYTWETLPGGATRMTLRNRGEPTGFAKVAAPLMRAAMRKATKKDCPGSRRCSSSRSRGSGSVPSLPGSVHVPLDNAPA